MPFLGTKYAGQYVVMCQIPKELISVRVNRVLSLWNSRTRGKDGCMACKVGERSARSDVCRLSR